MDRYEINIRKKQIEALCSNHDFVEAANIADSVDWRKVNSVKMLILVSEVYKVNRRYDDAKEILLMAYEHNPGGRNIVKALCELSIKMEDMAGYARYLNEYKKTVHESRDENGELSYDDTGVYVLQYKFLKSQGASAGELIEILKALKRVSYEEKWAYELALLYYQDGQEANCISECDELIVWFGTGKYVMKAMELKQEYVGLTEEQQRKYDAWKYGEQDIDSYVQNDFEEYDSPSEETAADPNPVPEPAPEPEIPIEIKQVDASRGPTREIPQKDILEMTGAKEEEEIHIMPLNIGMNSTMNLQAEIKKNLKEFLSNTGRIPGHKEVKDKLSPGAKEEAASDEKTEAKIERAEKKTVTRQERLGAKTQQDSMNEPIKPEKKDEDVAERASEETIEAEAPAQAGLEVKKEKADASEKEIEKPAPAPAIEEKAQSREFPESDFRESQKPANYPEYLSEDYYGQVTLNVPNEPEQLERQITGQMNFNEVLEAWSGKESVGFDDRLVKAFNSADSAPAEDEGEDAVNSEKASKASKEAETDPGFADKEVKQETADDDGKAALQSQGEAEKKDLPKPPLVPRKVQETVRRDSEEHVMREETQELEKAEDDTKSVESPLVSEVLEESHKEKPEPERGATVKAPAPEPQAPYITYGKDESSYVDIRREEIPATGRIPADEVNLTALLHAGQGMDTTFETTVQEDGFIDENALYREEDYAEENNYYQEGGYIEGNAYNQGGGYIENEVPYQEDQYLGGGGEYAFTDEESFVEENVDSPVLMPEPLRRDPTEGLSADEEELFSDFLVFPGMSDVILNALNDIRMKGDSGNVIITGNEQNMRVKLAAAISQDLRDTDDAFIGKIAKISADDFNSKNIEKAIVGLDGGSLLIQSAGRLSEHALSIMGRAMRQNGLNLILMLEDNKAPMRVLEHNRAWPGDIFNVRIDIPSFSNQDLVNLAKDYAKEKEYTIDDMAILALYRRIDELQTADHKVTAEEVEKIIDSAIASSNKKTIAHLFDLLGGKRYDDDDYIILREKDFERKG